MADERVNLTVDIDVTGDRELVSTSAKLLAFERVAKRLENRTNRLSGAMGALNLRFEQSGRSAGVFVKQLSLMDKVGAAFVKRARAMLFAVIAIGVEFGISALALASVNAAFAVGKFAMQAYNYGMQALAGTFAAVGAAALAAAAAFREFQAAQYQFRYKDSAELGSALDQSSYGLRSLYKDTTLATFGVTALAGAFAAVSKSSAFTPASKAALAAMADFAQASGDPAKSLQSAAAFIGMLQKEKKFTAEAINAAKQISPEFDKAFKKGSYKSTQEFMNDLLSGKLATEGGVAGQADAISRTLFGQFKAYISQALAEISDVGQRVLEPVKEAMFDIFKGLTRTFRRISGDLVAFGRGPFLSSLVGLTNKLEDFAVVMFRKFLPATEGFWKRTSEFFKGFAVYFREVRDALDPLREGGSIVIQTFGKPIVEIFRQIGYGVESLAQQAVENKDNFLAFGDALKSVVQGFFEVSRAVREAFAKALPIINPFISTVAQLLKMIAQIMGIATNLGGAVGGAGIIGGAVALAYKGRRSARFERGRQGSAGHSRRMTAEEAIYAGVPINDVINNPSKYQRSRGFQSISGNMGGGAGGRLGGLYTLAFGKTASKSGYKGAIATGKEFLGLPNQRISSVSGLKESFAGGNFGSAYNQARQDFRRAQRRGLIDPNAKFSRVKGLKAAARGSFSGLGVGAAMLGSAAANKYGTEEAQGGLQTGAALMAINPMIGLAVGGALTAYSAKTKRGGMFAGAISGAAIGSMIAGPLGAAVGGVLGGALGWVAAKRNQGKMVQSAMSRVGSAQLSSIAAAALQGVKGGNTKKARAMLAASGTLGRDFAAAGSQSARRKLLQPYIDAGIMSGNEVNLAVGQEKGAAAKSLNDTAATMRQALLPQFNQFDSIMKALKQSTGMTSEAIFDLAMRKNVNLYDTTLTLTDAVQKLGVGMVKTSQQLKDSMKDIAIGSLDVFTQFKKEKEMRDAIEASGQNIRAGDTSMDAFIDYYTKQQDYLSFVNPNSPIANFLTQAEQLGFGMNMGQGSLFAPGGAFEGRAPDAKTLELMRKAQAQTAAGTATTMSTQLGAMLAESGFQFSDVEGGTRAMENQIMSLINKAAAGDTTASMTLGKLEQDLLRGTALKGKSQQEITAYFSRLFGAGTGMMVDSGDAASRKFGNTGSLFGFTLEKELSGQLDPFKDVLAAEGKVMRDEFMNAIKSGFFEASDTPKWWNTAPDWWTGGFEAVLNDQGQITKLISMGDTASPKAMAIGDTSTSKTLRRTMGRHAAFNSMLPGKREVTSSLRNFNLGSPSSDHATGNAYDLVGQNLGRYSNLINSAGGFAEFHGAGGSRHLHVVPPPGPMGDTSTSMLSKMSGGGATNNYSGDTINITVNEASDAQATARAVAAEIMKMQRNWRQRS